jgi:hypothetical protein
MKTARNWVFKVTLPKIDASGQRTPFRKTDRKNNQNFCEADAAWNRGRTVEGF